MGTDRGSATVLGTQVTGVRLHVTREYILHYGLQRRSLIYVAKPALKKDNVCGTDIAVQSAASKRILIKRCLLPGIGRAVAS